MHEGTNQKAQQFGPPNLAGKLCDATLCQIWRIFQILSDNSTEFKNQLFEKVVKELSVNMKFTLLPIDLHLMVVLKAFITSSKPVSQNMSHHSMNRLV